jgi:hypothetical protein
LYSIERETLRRMIDYQLRAAGWETEPFDSIPFTVIVEAFKNIAQQLCQDATQDSRDRLEKKICDMLGIKA